MKKWAAVCMSTLRDYLFEHTHAGQLCVIMFNEDILALVYIDKKNLFINGINPDLLDKKVKYSYYDKFQINGTAVGAKLIFL